MGAFLIRAPTRGALRITLLTRLTFWIINRTKLPYRR